ncbi:MAG: transcription factor [Candidatus Methanofastidiosum methylothiophilum]|uniref:Transcription factor n=1 Tax=Candidatus Methanofastidiosum methylothiophilum TaxID=1705564 RepID=A0A150IT46_9EURY|nr:MAG: transcription factor [Candidatus Methanofastidiosum methylthiophilus]KYC48133.1 MAG: transcription factor [Candidatus Methanofastidiosum methylthiophilus]KYC50628.1 MAG: transcription factor [Candidatus Methanofastidiosum methylthiophilus]
MICEICGKTIQGKVFNVRVEGASVKVCDKCSRFGTDRQSWSKFGKGPISSEGIALPSKPRFSAPVKTTQEYTLVEDYHLVIKDARESKGWSQKDLARKMNEKESIIHHIETEGFALSNELIQKLEKVLDIKLKEKSDEGIDISKTKQSLKETTIGDIIKIKKK